MPDLGKLSLTTCLSPSHCLTFKLQPPGSAGFLDSCPADPAKTLAPDFHRHKSDVLEGEEGCNSDGFKQLKKGFHSNTLDDFVRDWFQRKIESGVSESRSFLPFLFGAKKMVLYYLRLIFWYYIFRFIMNYFSKARQRFWV